MGFYTLEKISIELHISPGTARNRLALGKDMPPSVRIGRRRLFPIDAYEKWVAAIVAPIQRDAPQAETPLAKKRGRPSNSVEKGPSA
jgi:hypothetical protein